MFSREFSNCKVSISKENILTAVIDLNKDAGLSQSKKSINKGTTNGNTKIPFGDVILNFGVNCYFKNPKYVVTEEDKAKYKEIYSK